MRRALRNEYNRVYGDGDGASGGGAGTSGGGTSGAWEGGAGGPASEKKEKSRSEGDGNAAQDSADDVHM